MLEVAVRVARPDVCCLCCGVVGGSWARLLLTATILNTVSIRLPEAECMRLHVQAGSALAVPITSCSQRLHIWLCS